MDFHDKHFHFMGIGGIGMSALAAMAARAGATVTGCDRSASALTKKLESSGIAVCIGHDANHMANADLLIHTSAVPPTHPERVAAGNRQEQRGKFLARFLDDGPSCGVCGTHGKTTTSWLLAHLLIEANLDPAVFIGGIVPQLAEGNYRFGSGPFVAELDESDGTFLYPNLSIAVMTNIDSDHLRYYQDDAALEQAFRSYAANVAESGVLVAGIDNHRVQDIFADHTGRKVSFGTDESADIRAVKLEADPDGTCFHMVKNGVDLGEFYIAMPGLHNVRNALAALAPALELGVPVERLRASLPLAKGVERRLEFLTLIQGVGLYTDYAHHPVEMAASLQALRQRHDGKILLVFQPHLYSRTRDYADAFAREIASADAALVLDIYPAREEPIPGVDAGMLVEKAARINPEAHGPFPLQAVEGLVMKMADRFAAVVFMGAGDIDAVARHLGEYGKRMDSLLE